MYCRNPLLFCCDTLLNGLVVVPDEMYLFKLGLLKIEKPV